MGIGICIYVHYASICVCIHIYIYYILMYTILYSLFVHSVRFMYIYI